MKPVRSNVESLGGNTSGKKIAMTLDMTALPHLMKVMTDLYEDKEEACIREYSTNARDAHIACKNTRPIEVVTPSPLVQQFKIIDRGIGLTTEDIEEIYSKYGASTKRASDEFNGVLGLGCKAALTYTSQFTVTGIKDGMKYVVKVSREEDGSGSMTVLKEIPTSEPDGVEILIPALTYNRFEEKAQKFFRFWDSGTVLLNGKEPEKIQGESIGKNFLIVPNTVAQDTIVMGGVPYPLRNNPFSIQLGASPNHKVVAWVEMGEVEFVPSREALQHGKVTENTVTRLTEEFKKLLTKEMEKKIGSAKSFPEALEAAIKWETIMGSSNKIKYKGKEIPRDFYIINITDGKIEPYASGDKIPREPIITTNANAYREGESYAQLKIARNILKSAYVISGFSAEKMTLTHKKKIQKYFAERELPKPSYYLLTKSKFSQAEKWFEDIFFDWEPISEIKLDKNQSLVYKKIAGSYDIWRNGILLYEQEAETIDTENPVYYFVTNKTKGKWLYGKTVTTFMDYMPEAEIVLLTSNREKKFKRDFPKAKTYREGAEEICDKIFKEIPEDDLISRAIRSKYPILRKLDPERIEDKKLKDLVEAARKPKLHKNIDKLGNVAPLLEMYQQDAKLEVKVENPLDAYPLLGHGTDKVHSHWYYYINHINELRSKGLKV